MTKRPNRALARVFDILRLVRCPICGAEPSRIEYQVHEPVDPLESYHPETLILECQGEEHPDDTRCLEINPPWLRIVGVGQGGHDTDEMERWLDEEFAAVKEMDDVLRSLGE